MPYLSNFARFDSIFTSPQPINGAYYWFLDERYRLIADQIAFFRAKNGRYEMKPIRNIFWARRGIPNTKATASRPRRRMTGEAFLGQNSWLRQGKSSRVIESHSSLRFILELFAWIQNAFEDLRTMFETPTPYIEFKISSCLSTPCEFLEKWMGVINLPSRCSLRRTQTGCAVSPLYSTPHEFMQSLQSSALPVSQIMH